MINGLYALINGRLRGVSKVVWKDVPESAINDLDRTENLLWTDLDLTPFTSGKARMAIVSLVMRADVIGTASYANLKIRKNGTSPAYYPVMIMDKVGTTAAVYRYKEVIIGLDDGQVMEYAITPGAGWQVDTRIRVLGYIE